MNIFKFLTVMCAIGILLIKPGDASAGETGGEDSMVFKGRPVEISTDFAVFSKYIWRGFKLDNDPVAQSGVYINACGFNASIWGNLDVSGRDGGKSDEVDYSVGYSYDLKNSLGAPLSVSGGYIYYDFPASNANSQEFYLGLCVDDLPFSPSFTWYHDFEDKDKGGGRGDYLAVKINKSIVLPDVPVTFNFGAHAGYNRRLFIKGHGGDIGLSAGIAYAVAKNCTFSPTVNYTIPLSGMKKTSDGGQKEELFLGAVFAVSV
ncbi:MAG: hypothetical protein PHV77_05075 [Candidatus Omnitrophica bacterium]|jgi:hypothetical protein|nr:hypothetical protein [Candidatus Omnitrophota bacterium]